MYFNVQSQEQFMPQNASCFRVRREMFEANKVDIVQWNAIELLFL